MRSFVWALLLAASVATAQLQNTHLAFNYLVEADNLAKQQKSSLFRSTELGNVTKPTNLTESDEISRQVSRLRQQSLELVEEDHGFINNVGAQVTGAIMQTINEATSAVSGATSAVSAAYTEAINPNTIPSFGAMFTGILGSFQYMFDMIGLPGATQSIKGVFDTIGVSSLFSTLGELLSPLQPVAEKVVEVLDYTSALYNKINRWTRPLQLVLKFIEELHFPMKILRFIAFGSCIWENKYGFMFGIQQGLYGMWPCAVQAIGLIPGFGTIALITGMLFDAVWFLMNNAGGGESTAVIGDSNSTLVNSTDMINGTTRYLNKMLLDL